MGMFLWHGGDGGMGVFIWHVGEMMMVWECSSGMEVR